MQNTGTIQIPLQLCQSSPKSTPAAVLNYKGAPKMRGDGLIINIVQIVRHKFYWFTSSISNGKLPKAKNVLIKTFCNSLKRQQPERMCWSVLHSSAPVQCHLPGWPPVSDTLVLQDTCVLLDSKANADLTILQNCTESQAYNTKVLLL